jgi:hypothetical protein
VEQNIGRSLGKSRTLLACCCDRHSNKFGFKALLCSLLMMEVER